LYISQCTPLFSWDFTNGWDHPNGITTGGAMVQQQRLDAIASALQVARLEPSCNGHP